MIMLVAVGILFALFSQTNYETGNLFFLWSLQFLGYFVLGGVAFKKRLWEKINMPVLVCFYCISVAVTSMGCGWLSNTASLTEGLMFYNYTNPSVVVMAVAVFLLAAKMEHLLSKINFSRAIVKTTLGIYLIHPLVLFVLFRFNVGRDFPSLLAIIINCIISYFLSLAATLLFQRIPLLKMTV
jgi:surface polysaccharide O-acyltransferase-like enzyme